tara:strand:- start:1043 stop:3619 length:2577 start_codon:yes stop_codon:yes gene_type:complete
MGIFKKSKIVDETIYGGTTADAFRVLAKTHWHNFTDPDGIETNELKFGGTYASDADERIIKTIENTEVAIDTGPFFCEFSARVRVVGDENYIENDDAWYDHIANNVITSISYLDHTFDIDIPFKEVELESINASSHAAYAKIDMFYNFFHQQYERIIQNEIYSERLLPNMYAFLSVSTPRDIIATNPAFLDLITLNQALPETYIYSLLEQSKASYRGVIETYDARDNYFESYATDGTNSLEDDALSALSARFSHMFLPHAKVEILNENENFKDFFPMYTEIEFQTDVNTNVADAIQNSGIGCTFMRDMFETLFDIEDTTRMSVAEGNFVNGYSYPILQIDDDGNYFFDQERSITTNSVRFVDLQEWIQTTYQQSVDPIGPEGVYIGDLTTEVAAAMSDEFPFYRSFIYILLTGYMRNLIQGSDTDGDGVVETGIRTFSDMMSGESCYSETIMYRVSKYEGEVDPSDYNTQPLQTFWLPNSSDIEIINFIDTQVKYGKQYTYTIYAYQVVFGTQYEYSNVAISKLISQSPQVCLELVDITSGEMIASQFPDSPRLYQAPELEGIANTYLSRTGMRYFSEFDVTYRPSIQIVEIPIYTKTGVLIDNPPLTPDVDFVPYFGVSQKIRMFLSGRIGVEEKHEIFFDEQERLLFNAIREKQGLLALEPITFRSDDFPYQYEIYRMTKPPQRYEDFRDYLIARVDTAYSVLDDTKYATAVEFEDTISTNIKYYYTFKAVDLHANISNPTQIYQFEMVDDGTSVYPVVEEYFVSEPVTTRLFKPADRLVHIVPKLRHRLINEAESGFEEATTAVGLGNKIKIGDADNAVWDNKFKIRLTSRKTGRKIDLNLQFDLKHIVTTSETN